MGWRGPIKASLAETYGVVYVSIGDRQIRDAPWPVDGYLYIIPEPCRHWVVEAAKQRGWDHPSIRTYLHNWKVRSGLPKER